MIFNFVRWLRQIWGWHTTRHSRLVWRLELSELCAVIISELSVVVFVITAVSILLAPFQNINEKYKWLLRKCHQIEIISIYMYIQFLMFLYRINGVPACANKNLLSSTLRDLWRFKGYVVSDANAVDYISTQHHYRDTTWDSVTEAVKAGVNLELASEHHVIYNEQVCSKKPFLCDSYAQRSRSIMHQTKLGKTLSMIKQKKTIICFEDVIISMHKG